MPRRHADGPEQLHRASGRASASRLIKAHLERESPVALSLHARTIVLTAAVPVTLPAAVVAVKPGHWQLYADRHRIELFPRPCRNCRDCDGGWWTGGAFPEWRRAAAGPTGASCASLLPLPAFPDEPPF